jgi:diguanylate cyclase (GGDEF)-like protein
LPVPFTSIVLSSPLDVALAVALGVLPLLLGIWLLLFSRTWHETRMARDASIRLALANDLGLSPRELTSLTTKALFKLREQAAFDDLTGVMRRAAGIAAAEREISRARRQKSPLTVAFLDVDGLKQANDKRGHAAGDQLLRGMASALRSGLRGQDLVVRYGGDEFVCVLPDTTAEAGRLKLHQIRAELAPAGIGFSIGVVQLERSDDVVSLLGRADSELYAAKARRPRVHNLPDKARSALA